MIINRIKNFLIILGGIILLSSFSANAQERTNLGVFNELVDSSVSNAVVFIPENVKTIKLELNKGSFAVFNSVIISALTKRGYKLVPDGNVFTLEYIINEAATSYGDIYRDGFLGDYFVPRNIVLTGNYDFSDSTIFTRSFTYSLQDTVRTDSISSLENPAYPFTQGRLPSEPFFSGILEPVIAVGTAALAVILFFTIRSK